MTFDPRRMFLALSAAGALTLAAPLSSYAQGATASVPNSPIAVYQDASDNDDNAADDQTAFIRTAVSDSATELKAARLAQDRASDPAVRQFASVLTTQYDRILQDASKVAAQSGVDARQAPTDDDETALIDDLSTSSGKQFDETYLRAFIQDQQTTLNDYLTARDEMDGEVAAYADRHVSILSDQLRAAVELARRLGVEVEES